MDDQKLIKSYVWFGDECFFVSTINRDSSARMGPRRFAETIVWKYDWAKNEREEMVYMDEGVENSICTHLDLCLRIHLTGIAEESD